MAVYMHDIHSRLSMLGVARTVGKWVSRILQHSRGIASQDWLKRVMLHDVTLSGAQFEALHD